MVHFPEYVGPQYIENLDQFKNVIPIVPITGHHFIGTEKHERTMFPISLAWCITFHKSQGMTLPLAIIDLGKREVCLGASYVALSRVRRLEHMVIENCTLDRFLKINSEKRKEDLTKLFKPLNKKNLKTIERWS